MRNAAKTWNKHLLTSLKTSSAFFILRKNLRCRYIRPPSGLIASRSACKMLETSVLVSNLWSQGPPRRPSRWPSRLLPATLQKALAMYPRPRKKRLRWLSPIARCDRNASHGFAIVTVTMLCARKSEHEEPPANQESNRDGFASSQKRPRLHCVVCKRADDFSVLKQDRSLKLRTLESADTRITM